MGTLEKGNLMDRFHDRLVNARDIHADLERAASRWTSLTKNVMKNSTLWRLCATLKSLRKER